MPAINWKMAIIGAIVFTIAAQVVHIVGAMAEMSYYTDPANFALWSPLMMPAAGPPGAEFYAASIIASFIIGLVFAAAYGLLKASIPGKASKKGMNFALLLFMLATVPGALSMGLVFAVPVGLIVAWAIEDLVIYLISCAVFAKTM